MTPMLNLPPARTTALAANCGSVRTTAVRAQVFLWDGAMCTRCCSDNELPREFALTLYPTRFSC
jgi:hypothetical protein